MGIGDGHNHPAGHLGFGQAQLAVGAGDDDVEPGEDLVGQVEGAVDQDVDLAAREQAEAVVLGIVGQLGVDLRRSRRAGRPAAPPTVRGRP